MGWGQEGPGCSGNALGVRANAQAKRLPPLHTVLAGADGAGPGNRPGVARVLQQLLYQPPLSGSLTGTDVDCDGGGRNASSMYALPLLQTRPPLSASPTGTDGCVE